MRYATRYNIEPCSLYSPSSGVTNYVAESLNAVIKRLLDWKEVPIDCLCLSLDYLQTFYFAEIQQGMIGVGEYKLRKEFQTLMQDPEDVRIPKCYNPDEIFKTVKMKLSESINMIVDNTDSDSNCSSSVELGSETNYPCSSDVKGIKDESSHPIPILNSTKSLIGKNKNMQHNQSQIALA